MELECLRSGAHSRLTATHLFEDHTTALPESLVRFFTGITETLAYGRAKASETTGNSIRIEFYSVALQSFLGDLGLSRDLNGPSVVLEFGNADCSLFKIPLSCSGKNVSIVTLSRRREIVAIGTLDFAKLDLRKSGLTVSAALRHGSAQTNISLIHCGSTIN